MKTEVGILAAIEKRHPSATLQSPPNEATPSYFDVLMSPSRSLRFAERQHQTVRPGEHRDRIGEIGDVGIGEAGAAQGSDFAGAGLRRRLRELGGEVRDGALARLQLRADAVGEEPVDHVLTLGELNVEPRMNRRAIDAAVEYRFDRRAQFA